jgi:putative FmdB family regulatory protein
MPTYEFRCPEGHEFEKFYRSIAGAPREVSCPVCGKIAERQLSAGGGLVFKGSGFYITDYGKDGKKSSASTSSESTSGGSGESKSETAPKSDATSSDAKPAKESKPPESKTAEKPASSGKKKSDE